MQKWYRDTTHGEIWNLTRQKSVYKQIVRCGSLCCSEHLNTFTIIMVFCTPFSESRQEKWNKITGI